MLVRIGRIAAPLDDIITRFTVSSIVNSMHGEGADQQISVLLPLYGLKLPYL